MARVRFKSDFIESNSPSNFIRVCIMTNKYIKSYSNTYQIEFQREMAEDWFNIPCIDISCLRQEFNECWLGRGPSQSEWISCIHLIVFPNKEQISILPKLPKLEMNSLQLRKTLDLLQFETTASIKKWLMLLLNNLNCSWLPRFISKSP